MPATSCAFSLDSRRLALQVGQLRDGVQLPVPEIARADPLLLDQHLLLRLGRRLCIDALGLPPQLLHAFAQLQLLPCVGGLAQLKELALALNDARRAGIVPALH